MRVTIDQVILVHLWLVRYASVHQIGSCISRQVLSGLVVNPVSSGSVSMLSWFSELVRALAKWVGGHFGWCFLFW